MTREGESKLFDFCVEQRRSFDAGEWLRCNVVSRDELGAAARFLAAVDWFGHQAELRRVATTLSPKPFEQLVQETRFEPARFSSMLRFRLRQAEAALP